jgi:LemA protein
MKAVIIVIVVLLVLGLFVGGKAVDIRNDLVRQREAITAQWSQVDVALRRRADLIPNLVETVKGFAKQEQTVFGQIAEARSRLLNARTPQDPVNDTAFTGPAPTRAVPNSPPEPATKFTTPFGMPAS